MESDTASHEEGGVTPPQGFEDETTKKKHELQIWKILETTKLTTGFEERIGKDLEFMGQRWRSLCENATFAHRSGGT